MSYKKANMNGKIFIQLGGLLRKRVLRIFNSEPDWEAVIPNICNETAEV